MAECRSGELVLEAEASKCLESAAGSRGDSVKDSDKVVDGTGTRGDGANDSDKVVDETGSRGDGANDSDKIVNETANLSLAAKLENMVDMEFDTDSRPYSLSALQQVPEPEFLQPLSEDFECPLCLQWLKEPTLTSCCGHHFCRECIEHVVREDHICPLCKEKGFQTFLNKDVQRKLNTQRVFCRQKSRGCGWVGELGRLERHLNAREGDCDFVEVECEFGPVGCIAKFPRKDLQRHREENVHKHLSLVSATSLRASKEQQQEIRELKQKLSRKEEEISALQEQVENLETSLSKTQDQFQQMEETLLQLDKRYVPPPDFVVTDFKQRKKDESEWYSPPFYSHVGGYKMCLRVNANGWGRGKGTHISIFVHMLPGENDDSLQWPFRGTVRVSLLNQQLEADHFSRVIKIDDEAPDSAAGRVKGLQIRSQEGWGFFRYIQHRMLSLPVSTYKVEYLKNDRLKFRVTSVKVSDPCDLKDTQKPRGVRKLL